MKWLHMADLHLGRRLDNFDLTDDQADVLAQIVRIAQTERPDGMLIAGDVYDRSVPPAEAVRMLDGFLTSLSAVCPVFIISGNHDSGERLSFAQALLARQNVHICGGYDGKLSPVTVGDTDVYMLPYLHPAQVRHALEKPELHTMQDAVRAVLETREKGCARYAALLAHLFVTASGAVPERSDSEISPVGTLEQTDASLFDDFDYVALGHIHGPQRVGRDEVRYAGSPLPYSFSEEHHRKCVAIWEPEAEQPVRLIPLTPLRAMRTVHGLLEELLSEGFDSRSHADFIAAVLTDATPQMDAAARLRQVYPNLVHVTYAARAGSAALNEHTANVEELSPETLFSEFYRLKTGADMTQKQAEVVATFLERARKEEGQT